MHTQAPADPWQLLGVPYSATDQQIKHRWREIIKTCHPDVGGNTDEFIELHQAYLSLMNKTAAAGKPAESKNRSPRYTAEEQEEKNRYYAQNYCENPRKTPNLTNKDEKSTERKSQRIAAGIHILWIALISWAALNVSAVLNISTSQKITMLAATIAGVILSEKIINRWWAPAATYAILLILLIGWGALG